MLIQLSRVSKNTFRATLLYPVLCLNTCIGYFRNGSHAIPLQRAFFTKIIILYSDDLVSKYFCQTLVLINIAKPVLCHSPQYYYCLFCLCQIPSANVVYTDPMVARVSVLSKGLEKVVCDQAFF